MLATVVKKSWMGIAFATDVVATALTYSLLPFPIQMYSLFGLAMDAFVLAREFFYSKPAHNQFRPYYGSLYAWR